MSNFLNHLSPYYTQNLFNSNSKETEKSKNSSKNSSTENLPRSEKSSTMPFDDKKPRRPAPRPPPNTKTDNPLPRPTRKAPVINKNTSQDHLDDGFEFDTVADLTEETFRKSKSMGDLGIHSNQTKTDQTEQETTKNDQTKLDMIQKIINLDPEDPFYHFMTLNIDCDGDFDKKCKFYENLKSSTVKGSFFNRKNFIHNKIQLF